jgi:hypothetical protein
MLRKNAFKITLLILLAWLCLAQTTKFPATVILPFTRSMYWGAGSMEVDGTGCTAAASDELIASGPNALLINCSDSDTATIEASTVMRGGWDASTITFTLAMSQIAASVVDVAMDFEGQCVSSGESYVAWTGANEERATITLVSAGKDLKATTPAATLLGTSCAAGDTFAWIGAIDATDSGSGIEGFSGVLGVLVEFGASTLGD